MLGAGVRCTPYCRVEVKSVQGVMPCSRQWVGMCAGFRRSLHAYVDCAAEDMPPNAAFPCRRPGRFHGLRCPRAGDRMHHMRRKVIYTSARDSRSGNRAISRRFHQAAPAAVLFSPVREFQQFDNSRHPSRHDHWANHPTSSLRKMPGSHKVTENTEERTLIVANSAATLAFPLFPSVPSELSVASYSRRQARGKPLSQHKKTPRRTGARRGVKDSSQARRHRS